MNEIFADGKDMNSETFLDYFKYQKSINFSKRLN